VVVVETLPITQNGKVDVRALPALVATSNSKAASSRPLNALETRMVEIWQDVLNVRPIGPRENFFDCGGHSLKAVELFASIEREMGPRLPLASIFDAPTVEKLCERVAQEGWGAPWEPLVVLNRLGSRPPFFCVSAGDGNTVGFGALARRMTADQPFYALQPRGLDGRQLLRRDIESMAADNVKAIQSVQRHGPYFLGGRCLGGLISYEMARQLRDKGEEIALLAVLDSLGPRWAPRLLANGIQFDEVMNLARLRAQSNGQHPGDIFHEPFGSQFVDWLREPVFVGAGTSINRYLYEAYQARPDVRLEYPDLAGEDLSRLVEWGWVSGRVELGMNPALLPELGRDGSGPRRPKPGWRRGVDRGRERTLDLIDVASRGKVRSLGPRRYERLQVVSSGAANVYRALPYDGRITLVRSNEFLGNIEIARWYGVDSAGIDESFIAVSHRSMLREPDVAILADNLKDLMDGRLDRGTERSVAS